MFQLDPQLAQDTVLLGRFELSQVLLHRDANYPWCILVPEREAAQEIYHLSLEDREQLMRESCHLAEVMADLLVPDKMNVAALGNLVPQLHLHHVARFKGDPAWPKAVWGVAAPASYSEQALAEISERLLNALTGAGFQPAQ